MADEQARETKELDFAFELKQADEAGSFTGHASVFGIEDSVRDIVKRGAFKRSLGELAAKGRMPAMLWSHDARQPIGVWEEMKEDRRGLLVRGRLLIDAIPQARAAHALMMAEPSGLSGLSIGFQTIESEIDEKRGIRKLTDVDLWEVSLVVFPALDVARVETVKDLSLEDIRTKRDVEAVLRDEGVSRQTAKVIAAGWHAPAQRDVEGDRKALAAWIHDRAKGLAA